MMRRRDYAIDLWKCLTREYTWKDSEVRGKLSRAPQEWRCWIGLHRIEYGTVYTGYWDPPEYGFECQECGIERLPLRLLVQDWLYQTWIGGKYLDLRAWLDKRRAASRGEYCKKHDWIFDFGEPCYDCQREATTV